jgi:hypothetical protein
MDMKALYRQCRREAEQSQSYAEVLADNFDVYQNYAPERPRLAARTRELINQKLRARSE